MWLESHDYYKFLLWRLDLPVKVHQNMPESFEVLIKFDSNINIEVIDKVFHFGT